jgi:hypothetical protein
MYIYIYIYNIYKYIYIYISRIGIGEEAASFGFELVINKPAEKDISFSNFHIMLYLTRQIKTKE